MSSSSHPNDKQSQSQSNDNDDEERNMVRRKRRKTLPTHADDNNNNNSNTNNNIDHTTKMEEIQHNQQQNNNESQDEKEKHVTSPVQPPIIDLTETDTEEEEEGNPFNNINNINNKQPSINHSTSSDTQSSSTASCNDSETQQSPLLPTTNTASVTAAGDGDSKGNLPRQSVKPRRQIQESKLQDNEKEDDHHMVQQSQTAMAEAKNGSVLENNHCPTAQTLAQNNHHHHRTEQISSTQQTVTAAKSMAQAKLPTKRSSQPTTATVLKPLIQANPTTIESSPLHSSNTGTKSAIQSEHFVIQMATPTTTAAFEARDNNNDLPVLVNNMQPFQPSTMKLGTERSAQRVERISSPDIKTLDGKCWKCAEPLSASLKPRKKNTLYSMNTIVDSCYTLHLHPLLHAPVCKVCVDEITELERQRRQLKNPKEGPIDDPPLSDNCFGCCSAGDLNDENGGRLMICDSCYRVFCKLCIAKANGGGSVGARALNQALKTDPWHCPVCCAPEPLQKLAERTKQFVEQRDRRHRSVKEIMNELDFAEKKKREAEEQLDHAEEKMIAIRKEIAAKFRSKQNNNNCRKEEEIEAQVQREIANWKQVFKNHEVCVLETIDNLKNELLVVRKKKDDDDMSTTEEDSICLADKEIDKQEKQLVHKKAPCIPARMEEKFDNVEDLDTDIKSDNDDEDENWEPPHTTAPMQQPMHHQPPHHPSPAPYYQPYPPREGPGTPGRGYNAPPPHDPNAPPPTYPPSGHPPMPLGYHYMLPPPYRYYPCPPPPHQGYAYPPPPPSYGYPPPQPDPRYQPAPEPAPYAPAPAPRVTAESSESRKNQARAESSDNEMEEDDLEIEEEGDDAGATARLKTYIKPRIPTAQEVLNRRSRKNAQSKAPSATLRQRIVEIEMKPEEERTEEEMYFEQSRQRKNNCSREHALGINQILAKPEKKRTKIEKQFFETALSAKDCKNEGNRLRQQRLKDLGLSTNESAIKPGISARGPLPPQYQQHLPPLGQPMHHGYPYPLPPPGHHPMGDIPMPPLPTTPHYHHHPYMQLPPPGFGSPGPMMFPSPGRQPPMPHGTPGQPLYMPSHYEHHPPPGQAPSGVNQQQRQQSPSHLKQKQNLDGSMSIQTRGSDDSKGDDGRAATGEEAAKTSMMENENAHGDDAKMAVYEKRKFNCTVS